jgi:hypothetical protein
MNARVLVDPPALGEDDWPRFEVMKPIAQIVLTNRDYVRDAELFRTRCGARLVAGADEVTQLAPLQSKKRFAKGIDCRRSARDPSTRQVGWRDRAAF